MKKFYYLFVLVLLWQNSFEQTTPVKLIKAKIADPAAYIKQLKLRGKTVFNRNLSTDREYDVDKDPGYTFEKTGSVKMKGKTMYESTNARPGMQEQPPPSISSLLVINTDLRDHGGPDPMVAVGERTIAVSNSSWIRFYDKETGHSLLNTSATDLFERFLSPTIGGVTNPEFASNFYDLPTDLPYWCSKSGPCDVDTVAKDPVTNLNVPCPEQTDEGLIQTAYDTRVFFQKEHRRFYIISALRNESSRDNNNYNETAGRDCEQYLIRLVGIAVSKSEDPNDGFYIYRTVENNYRDWPNAFADQDYLVIANKGGDERSDGHSLVTVYNFQQMKDGSGTVDGFTILQNDAQHTPQTVVPIANFQTNYLSEAFFFFQNKGTGDGKAKIWYLKKPASPSSIFNNPPTALSLAGDLNVSGADFLNGGNMCIVYHHNMVYAVTHQKMENATTTKKAGFGINYFRVPVIKKNNNTYEVSQDINQGFVHESFSSDDYSYLNPSIAVDAFQNLAMEFVRVPRSKSSTELPQIRYKVKFYQDANWRSSGLSKEWGVKEDDSYVEEKGKLTDYSIIVKDPFKLGYYWLAHKIQTNGHSGTYVGRVDLGSY